ncbi:unnamed protein product [Camellia sinensis]
MDDEERTMAEVWKLQKPQRTSSQKFSRSSSKKQGFIYLEDLQRFMLEDEALKTMSLLGGSSESEKISKASLKNWVRTKALTLNDTKTTVNKLHQMVNVLVGDRCEIDGVQEIIYPNSTLSMKPISNYYRSPDMGDTIELCVHIATPIEKIAIIRQGIISYIESKKDHWYPSPTVVPMNLEELNKLKISVWLRHRMNHQDMQGRWFRRALVVEEMIKIFKELDIEYLVVKLSMIELMKLNN